MMTQKNSKKKLLAAALIIVAVLILLSEIFGLFNAERVTPKDNTAPQQTTPNAPGPGADTTIAVTSTEANAQIDTASYGACKEFLSKFNQLEGQWFNANFSKPQDFEQYLTEGYSLNDVTIAIDQLVYPSFASKFRLNQLRKNSPWNEINEMRNQEQLENSVTATNENLSEVRSLPTPILSNYGQLSPSAQRQLASQADIIIDDVAYLITKSDLSDDAIIRLIDGLDDASARVGSGYLMDALSLLDFAARAGRVEVFKELISRGLAPTHDDYLGSTMEWALVGLMDCCERIQQRVEIIKQLIQLGVKARFEQQSAEQVSGELPGKRYKFERQAIEKLRQDYGLNLLTIEPRRQLVVSDHDSLLKKLESQQSKFIEQQLSLKQPRAMRQQCLETLANLPKQWQPRSAFSVINEVKANYPDSPGAVISWLAEIDPVLVDVYKKHFERSERVRLPLDQSDIEVVTDMLSQDDIDGAIAYLERQNLSEYDTTSLAVHLMTFDIGYYEQLSQSSLLTRNLDFHLLEKYGYTVDNIATLAQAGYDIYGNDSHGKPLIFYAAREANLELVKWLYQREAPYHTSGQGSDPLYQAIRVLGNGENLASAEQLISTLMRYQPSVDQFHQQRMAVVKLKYPQRYSQLIEQFPALAIDDDTPLPMVK